MAGECWLAIEVVGTRLEPVSKLKEGWRGDWLLSSDSIRFTTSADTPILCSTTASGSGRFGSRKKGASVCSPSLEVKCRLDDAGAFHSGGASTSGRISNSGLERNEGERMGKECSRNVDGLQWWKKGKYIKHLLAGAASAALSKSVVAPLERVRMDVVLGNSNRGAVGTAINVWKNEGLLGFWRGNGLNLMRNAPFKAINYFAFDVYSKFLLQLSGSRDGHAERFLAGAMAGITGVVTCFPLDTIRTRMLAPTRGQYSGIWNCISKMVQSEGIGSFYRGLPMSLLSIAPSCAVFYGVYHFLKEEHMKKNSGSSARNVTGVDAFHSLLFGAVAGACAEATVYPLEVIRRQMQMQCTSIGRRSAIGLQPFCFSSRVKDISAVCINIAQKKGIGGFYSGIAVNTLQVLPNAALSYFVFESLKNLWGVENQEK